MNIESVDGSEVLYAIEQGFTPPDVCELMGLSEGVTPLQRAPGELALDYVREEIAGKPMITKAQMTLLPKPMVDQVRAHALENAVVALLNAAMVDGSATVYAFGSAFSDRGRGGRDSRYPHEPR